MLQSVIKAVLICLMHYISSLQGICRRIWSLQIDAVADIKVTLTNTAEQYFTTATSYKTLFVVLCWRNLTCFCVWIQYILAKGHNLVKMIALWFYCAPSFWHECTGWRWFSQVWIWTKIYLVFFKMEIRELQTFTDTTVWCKLSADENESEMH